MTSRGFQEYNIKRSLSRAGYETEMFDTKAHIDSKLSMRENAANIQRMTGVGRTERHVSRTIEREIDRRGGRKFTFRGEYDQTGSSHTDIDRRMKAKPPGKRKSSSGRTYSERRKNRSDRPGLWI